MKISVIYPTYRPGGIDLLADSLSKIKGDYELIVVDDCEGRVERGMAEKFLHDKGILVSYYGKSKPKQYPQTRFGLANAMNTGALYATGDWYVFIHDLVFFRNDWLDCWVDAINSVDDKTLLHGVGEMCNCPPPSTAMNDFTLWGKGETIKIEGEHLWAPEEFELFHMGIPAKFMEEINGFDEHADSCGIFLLKSIISQAKMHDYKLKMDHTLRLYMLNHRIWETEEERKAADDSLWRIRGEYSQVQYEPLWTPKSQNRYWDYSVEKRKLYEQSEQPPHPSDLAP